MNSTFFTSNTYFIDEKQNYVNQDTCLRIFNDKGRLLGFVYQKISKTQKFLEKLLNKNILPFQFEVNDTQKNVQVSISKRWGFFLPSIVIKDEKGSSIGFVKQKIRLINYTFAIYRHPKQVIAHVKEDWKDNSIQIINTQGPEVGNIKKIWNGDMNEIFSTADKYNINLNQEYIDMSCKKQVLVAAILINMLLQERVSFQ
jgi:uncharacterized protein YxjI